METPIYDWLVVWLPFFIFPYIGNSHPNWLSYFSEGFKPPTRWGLVPKESHGKPAKRGHAFSSVGQRSGTAGSSVPSLALASPNVAPLVCCWTCRLLSNPQNRYYIIDYDILDIYIYICHVYLFTCLFPYLFACQYVYMFTGVHLRVGERWPRSCNFTCRHFGEFCWGSVISFIKNEPQQPRDFGPKNE